MGVFAILCAVGAVCAEGPSPAPSIRIREIYVPYDEFRARAAADPRGIIMDVEEYRELVLAAVRRSRAAPPPPLPPLESVVTSADYRGALQGKTVRFTGVLRVRVAAEGWVRADLGPPLPSLGSVTVDGEPGWVVRDDGPGSMPPGTPRSFLLLRGAGEHEARLEFSLPAQEHEDRWWIEGALPAAAVAGVRLTVPGQVEARSESGLLAADRAGEATVLNVALARPERFRIDWKQKKAPGEQSQVLAADHRISYLPRRENPVFAWESTVTVSRRKADNLVFREPDGARVVRVEGPLVHSWERSAGEVRVLLAEPALGEVKLSFQGVLEPAGERYVLGPPQLTGGFSNTGYLALGEPASEKLIVDSVAEAGEVAVSEAQTPPLDGTAKGAAGPARLYAFATPQARITVHVAPLPARYEARSAYLARVTETGVWLEGLARVTVREGRVYALTLSLPAPWRLLALEEAAGGDKAQAATAGQLRYEESGAAESRTVAILLDRAIDPARPLDLRMQFEHASYGEGRDWTRRELKLGIPAIAGAQTARTDLGLAIPSSMDALMADLPGWRSLTPEEIARAGLEEGLSVPDAPAGSALAAGLSTKDAAPRLDLALVHRAPRGEYRAVTQVLALERALRVRSDIRVALVDRPVEELVFRLPPSAGPSAVVLGPGFKEVEADPASGARTVRFLRPWLGTRQFRVEYETPHEPGAAAPIPAIEVGAGSRAQFVSERFVLLQSRGAVEIETRPGPGLSPVDVDELPDFAEPWSPGRILTAYRFHSTGDPGSLRTVVHDRAPVLSSLARTMALTTVLGREGASRTRAEILLAHTQKQYLRVRIPAGARSLAVTVNGEPIRAVRPEASGAGGRPGSEFSIPLPPQSYARLTITYERPDASGGLAALEPLGAFGTWTEEGPVLSGMPVGETTWTIYHPAGLVFSVDGGNLEPVDAPRRARFDSFAETFVARVLAGRLPLFTTFASEDEAGERAAIPDLTAEEMVGAGGGGTSARRAEAALKPKSEGPVPAARSGALLFQLIPEGRRIRAFKIGGAPRIELSYRSLSYSSFARRSVFVLTLFAGLLLSGRLRKYGGKRAPLFPHPLRCAPSTIGSARSPRSRALRLRRIGALRASPYLRSRPLSLRSRRWALAWFIGVGLFLATFTPLAFGFKSPLLLLPLAEGLLVLAVASAFLILARFLAARVRPPAPWTGAGTATARLLLVLGLLGLSGRASGADSAPPPPPPVPFDGVLIPYRPDALPGAAPGRERVYIPYQKFRELWTLAHPEAGQAPTLPYELIVGNAAYSLKLEGEAYRMLARIEVNVLTDRWVALPLPFNQAQIGRIRLDGTDVGVGQKDRVPFIEMQGRGKRVVEIELRGAVRSEPGEFRILSGLLAGSAATLSVDLPPGAKVQAVSPVPRGKAMVLPAVVTAGKDGTAARIDLGGADRIELAWSFPKIEGQTGSQTESQSYSRLKLTLDGYEVERIERVRVTGRPVDALQYRIAGGFRITEVAGADLSEWSVLGQAGGEERLQLFFQRPVAAAELRIRGRRAMDASAPLATLALEGAARIESFVGLHHAERRRFLPDVLSGMGRASREDLLRAFAVPAEEVADRIYRVYGTGEGQTLAAARAASEATVATELNGLLEMDRALVSGRSRYTVTGLGPLRHQVALPAGWSVLQVACDAMRSWEVVPADGGSRLIVHFRERGTSGTRITWTAETRFGAIPDRLPLPAFRAEPDDVASVRETQDWALAADDQLDLLVRDPGRLIPIPLEGAPRWVQFPSSASYRFAFRSAARSEGDAGAPLTLGAVKRQSQLGATVVSFARLAEDYLHLNARVIHRVRLAGRDRLRLRLPPGAELVSLDTRNQRSRDVRAEAAGTMVEIVLQSPVTGEHPLDLGYRVPRSGGEQPTVMPLVIFDGDARLVGVDQYVGVLQSGSTLISGSQRQALVPVEAESLPYLPDGVSHQSLKPTFRATAPDWSLTLLEEEIEVSPGLAALIELAEITTIVGIDGTARTRVAYTLRNRSLQFLVVELPEGADLWGVAIDGRPTAVGESPPVPGRARPGRTLRIPVEHVGSAGLSLEVALQYEERALALPRIRGSAALRGPRVQGIQVVETVWRLQFPGGYWVSTRGGNMREVAGSAQYARKVKNLLEQLGKIQKAANESDSRRVRDQAAREMARLEQALGDNLAELQGTNRSADEMAQTARLDRKDLEEQWAQNDQLIQESAEAAKNLREARQGREKKKGEAQTPTKGEQSFSDAANYQRGSWRGGKQAREVQTQTGPAAPAGQSLEALLDPTPFQGLRGLELTRPAPDAEVSQPAAVDGSRGLRPAPEPQGAGAAPGLETPPEDKGRLAYTFLRPGGDAELALSIVRRDSVPRLSAAAALALAPVVLFLAWKRRRG